jgi:ubiquinone biosynthesis protein COQ4
MVNTFEQEQAVSNTNRARRPQEVEFFGLFQRNVFDPYDVEAGFRLPEMLAAALGENFMVQYAAHLAAQPYFETMSRERYTPPAYSVEDLAGYAPGTLGQAYYAFMTRHNLSPLEMDTPTDELDDVSYHGLRVGQTHDIWHVVAGYDADGIGELALQAFYLGQDALFYPATAIISSGLLSSLFLRPDLLASTLISISEAYFRGKNAAPLYPTRFEEMWARPLADIQAELKLTSPQHYQPGDFKAVEMYA